MTAAATVYVRGDVTVYGTRSGPGVFVNFDRVDGEASRTCASRPDRPGAGYEYVFTQHVVGERCVGGVAKRVEAGKHVGGDGGVQLLALTHISARYAGSEVAEEAAAIFPSTVVPRDFDLIDVPLHERGPPELVERGGRRARRQDVGSGS